MVQSSFYGDTPNYAADYPTQNDSNTNSGPNTPAPSSFYPDGGVYEQLANSDEVLEAADAATAAAAAAAASAAAAAASAASISAGGYAPIASPVFTGDPRAPTPTVGDSDTSIATTGFVTAAIAAVGGGALPATATPLMDSGAGAVGTGSKYAREDHVHPTDTSRAPLNAPAFTGNPTAPTPPLGNNTTRLATTAYVDGTVASKADLASPALTGTPTAPTATAGTNTTQLATTAFVEAARVILAAADALKAPLASPALTGNPTAPTQAANDNSTKLATTAYVDAKEGSATPLIDGTAAVGTSHLFARQDHVHPTDTSRLATAGNQTVTGGFNLTPNNLGSITSFTLNPLLGNYQYGTNNAAATWTAPTSDCAIDVLVTNGATAGAITFSGFTVGSSTGDALTTTNTNKFIISIRRINSVSTYTIKALQ